MRVKIYTEQLMVRLNKQTMLRLQDICQQLQMNEGTYGRKAIEKCLKKNCIKAEK